uniref:Uncharacterized protein n=1 Tax=Neovison vison TaxID=452646 RepID=A0A8C7BV40_NEOVI
MGIVWNDFILLLLFTCGSMVLVNKECCYLSEKVAISLKSKKPETNAVIVI